MAKPLSLDALWDAAAPAGCPFHPETLGDLPGAARGYLTHAIAPGTPLASAVRLKMHGEIKLGGWCPFRAEQVIRAGRGLIWNATVFRGGLPIVGSDRFVDGEGAMQWKLLGLFPVMAGDGADVTRSAAGRLQAESVWLPSLLVGDIVTWEAPDPACPRVRLNTCGYSGTVELALDASGGLKGLSLSRWGNPDGGEFHAHPFGAVVEEEGTFDGYTIPTRLRVGWHVGTPRFETEGEFIRIRVDSAEYR